MYKGLTIAAVIPAFNEEAFILRTLTNMPPILDWLLVIDDCSLDNTANVVASFLDSRVKLVRHQHNRGVGAAIFTGYDEALEVGADVSVVMAGDGQMDPQDLPALLEPLARGEADYVKGNRFLHGEVHNSMPKIRYWGNRSLSFLTRATSGYNHISDSQCGYTAITRQTLRSLNLSTVYRRYGYPNDLLAHLHSVNARVAQVCVRPVYDGQASGINPLRSILPLSGVLLRSFVSRVLRESPLTKRHPTSR